MHPTTTQDLYIRYGDIPDNEQSHDHYHDQTLKGVSVYHASTHLADAYYIDNGYTPTIRGHSYNGGVDPAVMDRPAFLVTGRKVGTGPDGEPLIRGVEIVAELAPNRDHSIWFPVNEVTA